MNKKLIIGLAGSLIVAVLLAYYYLSKKNNTGTANSNTNPGNIEGNPPAATLKVTPAFQPLPSPEKEIVIIMNWLDANKPEWIATIEKDWGLTHNQALAFLAIREAKTDKQNIPVDYAGSTDPDGHYEWVKKYVQ